MENDEPNIANSHMIMCRGTDLEGKFVFAKDDAEPVIVNAWVDGKNSVKCRYLTPRPNSPSEEYCNCQNLIKKRESFKEDRLPKCIYAGL